MSTTVVIRPGETDFDLEERIQGSLDIPLNSRGQVQVEEVIEQLRTAPPDVIYCSPSEPSLSTAQALGDALGVSVKKLEGLENLDLGLWQGMLLDDLRRKHPRVFKQWQDSPRSVCPPEGETCEEAFKRVSKALRKPMKRKADFAVVASEPLASMVTCVLRGTELRLLGPVCGCEDAQRVEFIGAGAVADGESPQNGSTVADPVGRTPTNGRLVQEVQHELSRASEFNHRSGAAHA
ncbi:Phosphoserine phosphatase 1 [Maioricimonas rarisocia]|uniref:Phosphoserine phosphatase 1 n=1 Tax=Maioricimonas rarisocia TaxID=2528026 RepID=A0A517Z2Q9_9PLAN|nr:histidine phosphatase family protein [Maioricimonas rarisocia]QDU36745.1 Phosphoserine phosphatase 1 [Maioricimonas rarisocia]